MLIELAGPSGVGKTTIARQLEAEKTRAGDQTYAGLEEFIHQTHSSEYLQNFIAPALSCITRASAAALSEKVHIMDEGLLQQGVLMNILGLSDKNVERWFYLLPADNVIYLLIDLPPGIILRQRFQDTTRKRALDIKDIKKQIRYFNKAYHILRSRGANIIRIDNELDAVKKITKIIESCR